MTGTGRFIYYEVYGSSGLREDGTKKFNPMIDPEMNKITEIKEGEFFEGKSDGYNRMKNVEKDAKVGFWSEDSGYG